MTDPSPLFSKLQALAAPDDLYDGFARVICTAGRPDARSAVFDAIDMTVLDRRLVFDFAGATVSLSVAGRRLRGVLAVTGAGVRDVPVGVPLAVDDDSAIHAVCYFIARLCQTAPRITVTSLAPTPFAAKADTGVPVSTLRRHWPETDPVPAGGSAMEQFLAQNAAVLSGFVRARDGKIAARQGDSDPLETIWRDQFGPFRQRQQAIFPRADGPLLMCLDTVLDGGRAAAIALVGDDAAVFSYQPDSVAAILGSWWAITGQKGA